MNRYTVIIAGSGRSGTTWVQDSLANANGLATLFEPLHPIGVKSAIPFAYRYVKVDANIPELKSFMDRVFLDEKHSLWANYRIRPDRFNILRYGPKATLFYFLKLIKHYRQYSNNNKKGMIVKYIRANLMLPWLVQQYQLPTVLIVRHPCAVIVSRFKLPSADWNAQKALDKYRTNEDVKNLIADEFGVGIEEPMSAVSAMACVWCIENVLPVKWAGDFGYGVVAYEHLLMHPETEWARLTGMLGLSVIPRHEILETPSQQVAPDMLNRVFTPQHLDKWRNQLNSDDLDAIAKMLDRFSCTFYSVDSVLPQGLVDLITS